MSETGNQNLCALSVVGIVVDKGKGKKTVKLLNSKGFDYHFAMLGRGTAPSEMQSYLGFNEPEKTLIVAVVTKDSVSEVMRILKEDFGIERNNAGIAFAISMQSICSKGVMEYLEGNK